MMPPKVPQRTCVACRQCHPKYKLFRVVRLAKDRTAQYDALGKAQGRGVYLCRNLSCVTIARQKHLLERSLRCTVRPEIYEALTHSVENYTDTPQKTEP